jgi:hypothetical protein
LQAAGKNAVFGAIHRCNPLKPGISSTILELAGDGDSTAPACVAQKILKDSFSPLMAKFKKFGRRKINKNGITENKQD